MQLDAPSAPGLPRSATEIVTLALTGWQRPETVARAVREYAGGFGVAATLVDARDGRASFRLHGDQAIVPALAVGIVDWWVLVRRFPCYIPFVTP